MVCWECPLATVPPELCLQSVRKRSSCPRQEAFWGPDHSNGLMVEIIKFQCWETVHVLALLKSPAQA